MRQTSDTSAVEDFAEAWDAFVLAVRRAQARGQQQAPDELTLSQYYLVLPLDGGRSAALCELAEGAGIAPPTATRMIDGLERAGLVRRDRSPEDRRTVLISLTPEGRRRLRRRARWLRVRRELLYSQLEPEEREHSRHLLRHLAELLGDL